MTKNCFENGFEYIEIHNKPPIAKTTSKAIIILPIIRKLLVLLLKWEHNSVANMVCFF